MRKKFLSLILTACMVLTLLPTTAFAAETTNDFDDFSVTYDDAGTAPTFDISSNTLTFGAPGEYTVGMAEGKDSTSDVIVVSASDVTLNLDGVSIEAPDGSSEAPDGANALTTINGTVLNITADSSLTGGIGAIINPMGGGNGNGGSGVVGNVTITGAATLTATGGIGGSAAMGISGTGGAGISGDVAVTGAVTLTAIGGIGGTSVTSTSGTGGAGISGSLTVTDHATVSLEGGFSSSTPGSALTGTLTATGFIIKGGYFSEMDVIASSDDRLNQFRYLSVEPAPSVAEIGSTGYPTLQAAVDAVGEGQTVKLLGDITITDSSSITISGANSFTLDLNGKTLDGGSGNTSLIEHTGSGTLTIEDSGTGGKMTSKRSVAGDAGNIGTVGTAELSAGNGNLTLLSGTIENSSDLGSGIFNNGTGTVSIQDGAVKANECGVNNKSGNVSVSGGEVSANKMNAAAIVSSAGQVTLSGGSIYNPTYVGVGLSNSSLVVSGGSPVIQGGVAAMSVAPTVDSDTIGKVIASTSYDGSNPVANYNAGQITSYKYLTFVVKVTPTAAEYAAASPAAAPGTDYVLDDTVTPHTLTICTDKGAAFWSASGTEYLDYTVLLANDIDVSGFQWTPVGNGSGVPFTGSFDGQGHSISGLTITAANNAYAGLFGGTQSATIQNLCVSGTIEVSETGSSLYIGGIVGVMGDDSTIRNCCSHVAIRGAASGGDEINAGGIVGLLNSGTIENCFSTGDLSGTGAGTVIAGGIYGAISSYGGNIGIVKNSYNTGSVSGNGSSITFLGALGGAVGRNIVLENCYYLSGAASAAFGSGSSANVGSFTAGTADTLLVALNGWVAETDSTDYRTWTADNLITPVNNGYPVFGAAWGTETPIFVNCFGRVKPAKDETPNAGMDDYGYTFSGWYTAPNGAGTKLDDGDPGTIGTHYYAKWTYNGHTVRTTALDLRDISGNKLYGCAKNGDVYINAAEGWTWYAAQTVVGSSTYAANTLVLSGLTLHTAASTALSVPEGTTIVAAEGTENKALSGYTSSINEDAEAYGIYGEGALNIRGGGSLNILADSANSVVKNSSSIGVFSEGDLTISDAVTVTARGKSASGDNGGNSSAGISSRTAITISGGTVTATGGSADTSIGIYCGYDEGGETEGSIVINGGTVAATGGNASDGGISIGLGSMITITISGGTVTAKSGSAGTSVAVFALDALTVGNTEKVASIENASGITRSNGAITGNALTMSGTSAVGITFTTYDITAGTATNGSYTVKVNGSLAAWAQLSDTVTITPTASSGYELDTITVCKTGDTATTVPVTNGRFTMPAYAVTVSVTFKAVAEPPSGGGTPTGGGTTAPTGAPVIVDGKTVNIGTEKKSGDTTTVTVDQTKLGTNIGAAAAGSSVVVPVSENGAATASLMVQNIADMAAKGMTLTVQSGGVAYHLNTSAIDTPWLTAAFPDADMSKVPFDVTIANSSVSVEGETLVLSPVEFTVTAIYNGQTVDVDTFSAYVDRVIEVTAEQAAKITTAVVVNADGSVRHVPTSVLEKDGRYYAVINSRTNSTYALIQNEVTFADAEGKWYEAAVNEMGSRKIIEGRGVSAFDGEASITRAEFSVILLRALGLPTDGTSTFSDVPPDAWYAGAAATAAQYGLVAGKGDNRFDPSANITRQEVMLMLQRAAALTAFSGTSGALDGFADADGVGSWAWDAAEWSVGSGLIQGVDGKLNPAADITRAESAAMILRLLQKSGLVDVRSQA